MGWLYPRMIAHRGGGTLAPENTLAAMREGYARGYRAVEFDVMLTADEVPVLMHDPDFGRTISGTGSVATSLSKDLLHRDAGAWYGSQYAGETVPRYEEVIGYCGEHGIFMNVEIKPAPGTDERCGTVVAELTRRVYTTASAARQRVLFSSFSPLALKAAQQSAPDVARGHLFDSIPADWQSRLEDLACVSLHCNHRHLTRALAQRVRAAGYGLMCYTVNELARARELFDWGVDALCTDRIDLIGADFV